MFSEYVDAGWKLCAIDFPNKAPTYALWQKNPIDAEVAGVIRGGGLLHAYSGTCALDIDDLEKARPWLAERGVDVDALLAAPDAVKISSGRPGRAKLLYRLKIPLITFKPEGSGVELRCATKRGTSVQDCLPPTVHPDTRKPYRWEYNRDELLGATWRELPPIPPTLKAAWKTLLNENVPNATRTEPSESPALAKIEKWLMPLDPNMDYDQGPQSWIGVGMKLHHATGGAQEGLELWDRWSSGATRLDKEGRSVYKGIENCRVHWISFSSPPGKVIATLDNELPADADEFEVVTEAVPTLAEKAAAVPADVVANNKAKAYQRKAARTALEKRLVYVLSSERYFDTQRHKVISSDSALEHQFTAMMPRRNGARINPVKELKQSTTKRFVEGIGFHPGEGPIFEVEGDAFANMYRDRLPEPLEPTKLEIEKIDWIFNRIDDPIYIHWLKQYYGHVVQHPAVKLRTAPLIWSETQRNGKSTLVKTIPMRLVGREFSSEASYDVLNTTFNDYVIGAWHVHLTEFRAATRGERGMINNKLKAYIADDMVTAHPKGGRSYTMPNHFFVTASSNEEDAAAIDNNDERWGIHELKVPKYTGSEIKWIYHEFLLTPRSAAVLRHYFLNISLEGFDAAGSAPMTEDKQQMAASSVPADVELLNTMFDEHSEFFERDVVLTSEVAEYVQRRGFRYMSAARIGRILAKEPFNGISKVFRSKKGTFRCVIVRNHSKWMEMPGTEIMSHVNGDDDFDFLA